MKKRFLSAAIAVLFLILNASLPVLAYSDGAPKYATPAGYNDHDYQLLVTFLELIDVYGVKNGEKLAEAIGKVYDPTDPSTWSEVFYEDEPLEYGVVWNDFGSSGKRVAALYFRNITLVGGLDVSCCEKLGGIYSNYSKIESVYAADCPELYSVTMTNGYLIDAFFPNCPRLRWVELNNNSLTQVDFSGCSWLYSLNIECNMLGAIDVSDSPELGWFSCARNDLTSLDLTHNGDLYHIDCSHNRLTALDVTHNPELIGIVACCNHLTSIDLSHDPEVEMLDLRENALVSIDLTANHVQHFDLISAEGSGTVGVAYGWSEDLDDPSNEDSILLDCAAAKPNAGSEFLGWYSENGEFLTGEPELDYGVFGVSRAVARFTEAELIPGDADGNGVVDMTDALTVLRAAMGLVQLAGEAEALCDVNHDGAVSITDALLILRCAMGIIQGL